MEEVIGDGGGGSGTRGRRRSASWQAQLGGAGRWLCAGDDGGRRWGGGTYLRQLCKYVVLFANLPMCWDFDINFGTEGVLSLV